MTQRAILWRNFIKIKGIFFFQEITVRFIVINTAMTH